ncbi:uncharacterized protein LOC129595998 [Paramacrobiotus metropolitanus]|uniref:uncharacterized protein LOC129595998 n=1 Tax=Paramacrobiotus metropolitanus TaxID=2943436 RepID=UPI002445B6B4|nr:uncharacterized protein LOC129595998 [Paramacrobiotus metropolitanus]
MLRVLCAAVLLCGAVYGQLVVPNVSEMFGQMFGPNCTNADQMALFTCSMDMQNQTMQNVDIFQQSGEIFMSGNITEAQAKDILDAFCGLMTSMISCIRPIADRCFTSPLADWSFHMNEDMLLMCAAANRYQYFTEIVRCNKKLDVYNTIANDPQLPLIVEEITNLTLSSMGPNMSNISGIMDVPPQTFIAIFCRMFSRVEELISLEKVNATCGVGAHAAYTDLYSFVRRMYHCDGEHLNHNESTTIPPFVNTTVVAGNETVPTQTTIVLPANGTSPTPLVVRPDSTQAPNGNGTSPNPGGNGNAGNSMQLASGSVFYSLIAVIMAIVMVHRQD